MKHQWDRMERSEIVVCLACRCAIEPQRIMFMGQANSIVLAEFLRILVEDCPAAEVTTELISRPTLVTISADLEVNPDAVARVERIAAKDVTVTNVYFIGGDLKVIYKPDHSTIVALLKGETE